MTEEEKKIKKREYQKEYYKKNKERAKELDKKRYHKNKEAHNKKIKENGYKSQTKYRHAYRDIINKKKHEYLEQHPEKFLLDSARKNAKVKGLEFDIDIQDIIIPEFCPLLKFKLTNVHGAGHTLTNISIDRIDNSKGYVKGNVQIISRIANIMKSNASKEQLVEFAKSILNMYELS